MDQALQSHIDEANKLLGERNYDEIVTLIQPLLIRETEGQAQRVYGMALLGQGKYQESVHILMTAAQLLPQDATVAFAYGNAMHLNGQSEGGRASFERALGLNPNHPGARLGFLNASKALATRDEPSDPMKAIEWLYGAWQQDTTNSELANMILDIYIKNGWADSARQYAELLPPQLKNSEAVRAKLKSLPAEAPPINPANIQAAPPLNGVARQVAAAPIFETCPFCKQQIVAGVHTCPHCKMIIRAKAMPGADYKPEWQEVVLNILCWIGMGIGVLQLIMIFVTQTQSTPAGALFMVISCVQIFANLLILQRNDFWMNIAKWLYVITCFRSLLNAFSSSMMMGSVYGVDRQVQSLILVIALVVAAFSGFMVYLLIHEGE